MVQGVQKDLPYNQMHSVDRRQANTGWLLRRCVKGDAAEFRRGRGSRVPDRHECPRSLGAQLSTIFGVDAALGPKVRIDNGRNTNTARLCRPSLANSYDFGVGGFPGKGDLRDAVRQSSLRKQSTQAPIASG